MSHSDSNQSGFDEALEAFLDGTMSEGQRSSFQASLGGDDWRSRQVDLQAQIDARLKGLFEVESPSVMQLALLLKRNEASPTVAFATDSPPRTRKSMRRTLAVCVGAGIAAAVVGFAYIFQPIGGGARDEPQFATRNLHDIYRDAVASGFEPSYECHEPARFAATFQQRQGKPLQLLPMPPGTRMLGLAYAGGMSRNTTAMLSYVKEAPVMVFVDKAENDFSSVPPMMVEGLHIFRSERDGLVFYEVSPLPTPEVASFLAQAAR